MLYYIGQGVGVLAMIESFFIYQIADRRKMVAAKLIDDVLWVTHFLLIGGYTGALTTGIAIFREIVFYFRGEKKWASSVWWAVGFSLLFASCAPLTWKNIYSIFPAAASVVSTWVFWVKNTAVGKLIQLPSAACMFVYDIVYRSYSGTLTQVITLASIILFFIKKLTHREKAENASANQ